MSSREREGTVRPRLCSGASTRPLNSSVRGHLRVTTPPEARIGIVARLGSVMLVLCPIVAVFRFSQRGHISWWGWIAAVVVSVPSCLLFCFIAIKGRGPQWLTHSHRK
jgi:hypothetical protein